MGEPDDLRAVIAVLAGPDWSSQVFKLVLHLETHGHFALFFLWGDLDENSDLISFSEGNNAARQKTKERWVSQVLKQLLSEICSDTTEEGCSVYSPWAEYALLGMLPCFVTYSPLLLLQGPAAPPAPRPERGYPHSMLTASGTSAKQNMPALATGAVYPAVQQGTAVAYSSSCSKRLPERIPFWRHLCHTPHCVLLTATVNPLLAKERMTQGVPGGN